MSKENTTSGLYGKAFVYSLISMFGLGAFVKTGPSLIWVILFLFTSLLFFKIFCLKRTKQIKSAALVFGMIVSLLVFLEYEISHNNGIDFYPQIILMLLGLICFFSVTFQGVFSFLLTDPLPVSSYNSSGRGKRIFFFTALIFLFWLPYFFACFPGNLTSDSLGEIRQQLGLSPLSNHHPVIHQLMIRPFLILSRLNGSMVSSVAAFSLVQMAVLALVFSVCIEYLRHRGVGRGVRIAVFVFYSLYTVNGFYSVTMYKDVPFSAAALLLMIILLKEADGEFSGSPAKRLLSLVAAVLVAFLFCTLRNNGFYAFILGFIFVIIFNIKKCGRFLIIFVTTVALVFGYNHFLFDVLGVSRSSTGEMMSLPLQMLARIVKLDAPDLESEDFSVLGEVISDYDVLSSRYVPDNSDPVKSSEVFLADRFDAAPVKYLKSWSKVCLSHPETAAEAFLIHTYGFWAPDENYSSISARIHENDLGLEQASSTESFRNFLIGLHTSLSSSQPFSVLYSIGFMVILYLFSFLLLLLKKAFRYAGAVMILFFLWLTAVAGPVCFYHYVYGLTVSLPLFLALSLSCTNASEVKNEK